MGKERNHRTYTKHKMKRSKKKEKKGMKFLFPFCFSHFAIQFVFRAYSALLLCYSMLMFCYVIHSFYCIEAKFTGWEGGYDTDRMMKGDKNVSIRFKIHTITRSILSHKFFFCYCCCCFCCFSVSLVLFKLFFFCSVLWMCLTSRKYPHFGIFYAF